MYIFEYQGVNADKYICLDMPDAYKAYLDICIYLQLHFKIEIYRYIYIYVLYKYICMDL